MKFSSLFILLCSLNPARKTNFVLIPDTQVQINQKNDLICQYYRDKIYDASGNLVDDTSKKDIESIIQSFETKNCYNNPTLPVLDKELISTLHDTLKNK